MLLGDRDGWEYAIAFHGSDDECHGIFGEGIDAHFGVGELVDNKGLHVVVIQGFEVRRVSDTAFDILVDAQG